MNKDHKEQLMVERGRTEAFKPPVTVRTGQMMKHKKLLRISRSEERIKLPEVKMLDEQRHNVLGHLHTLRSKIPVFQAHVAENVEYGFSAFC